MPQSRYDCGYGAFVADMRHYLYLPGYWVCPPAWTSGGVGKSATEEENNSGRNRFSSTSLFWCPLSSFMIISILAGWNQVGTLPHFEMGFFCMSSNTESMAFTSPTCRRNLINPSFWLFLTENKDEERHCEYYHHLILYHVSIYSNPCLY